LIVKLTLIIQQIKTFHLHQNKKRIKWAFLIGKPNVTAFLKIYKLMWFIFVV